MTAAAVFEPSVKWLSDSSGVAFLLFPRRLGLRELNFTLDTFFPDRDGWRCHSHDGDCCGRTFGNRVRVKRSRTRTLIVQRMGRDI